MSHVLAQRLHPLGHLHLGELGHREGHRLMGAAWSRAWRRVPEWRALLSCRGQELWRARRQLPPGTLLPLGAACVVVRDASTFLDYERRGLIEDKGKRWASGCPLTAASGETWGRQR